MRPILFESSWLVIYAYPLFMGIAWGLGYRFSQYYLEKYRPEVTNRNFQFLFWGIFVAAWMGSKVFFLISSAGNEFHDYLGAQNFWLGGGFVFYGGFIFALTYVLFYCLVLKRFKLADTGFFLPALALGHGIGRVGCFLAGCCYGTVCHLPWAIHLHQADRHPVQLYEATLLLALALGLHTLLRKGRTPRDLLFVYLITYSVGRFILEFFRGDKIRGVYTLGLSTSQFVSLAIFFSVWLIWVILRLRKSNKRFI